MPPGLLSAGLLSAEPQARTAPSETGVADEPQHDLSTA